MLISLLYYVLGPRKQSSDAEFKKDLLKILSEGSKTPDGVEGFLLQLGDILRKLPYKNRRQFQPQQIYRAKQKGHFDHYNYTFYLIFK